MNAPTGTLWSLAGSFALLSMFAIGGANSAIPEMHRLAVDVHHWMNDREFTDMFALAQVTPGPNVIIVTLIGYHVAGILGAAVATLAMCGPTCTFAFFAGRALERFRGTAGHAALAGGIVPVVLGLTAASATVIASSADFNWVAAGLTAAAALICYFVPLHPLWLFGAAALLGLMGVV
jgi:chromate transporter